MSGSNFFEFDKCDGTLFCLNTKKFECVTHSITISVRRQNGYEYSTSAVFPYVTDFFLCFYDFSPDRSDTVVWSRISIFCFDL